jgi:hypothetical protein
MKKLTTSPRSTIFISGILVAILSPSFFIILYFLSVLSSNQKTKCTKNASEQGHPTHFGQSENIVTTKWIDLI